MSASENSLRHTPRGGLEHRVFSGMGPSDQVVAAYAFEPALDDAQIARAQAELDRWSEAAARADADEPCHSAEPWLSPRTVRIQVHNLVEPREVLAAFEAWLAANLPLREAHYARWAPVPEEERLAVVLDPEAPQEQTEFRTHADYLRAVFDPAEAPPASEYESQGNGAFETKLGDVVVEERGIPLHLPPLRLAYGTARAAFTPADVRTRAVRDALGSALAAGFAGLAATKPPRFFDHTGKLGEIDRIQVGNRQGYGFAFASPELVQRLSATRYRYREPELFEALIPLIRAQGLAPTVTWQRFGKPYAGEFRTVEMHVVQLWEPGEPYKA